MDPIIKELTASNKRLSISLKQELIKNRKLSEKIDLLEKEKEQANKKIAATEYEIGILKSKDTESYYRHFKVEGSLRDQISSLKYQLRAVFAEKNVL